MKSKLPEIVRGQHPTPAWGDEELVAACREGDQRAWTALVKKYKSLVYSVPVKYQMSQEDAADIFQSVWLELYNELSRLRQPAALKSWLVTVASNQCYHWKLKRRKQGERDSDLDMEAIQDDRSMERLHEEVEREQTLREAIVRLPARCQTMVQMLFYSDPPLPYSEVARRLGLAEGSIGFIRGRCLQKLRRILEEQRF